jgi:hypothetical protein
MRKTTIKRAAAAIMAVAMLLCGAFSVTAGALTVKDTPTLVEANFIEITPFASNYMSNWTPLLTKSLYGANVTFTSKYSGSIEIELQNSSGGKITSFTQSFSDKNSIAYTTSRTTASGTYRIVIRVTINGTTETRTSHYMTI